MQGNIFCEECFIYRAIINSRGINSLQLPGRISTLTEGVLFSLIGARLFSYTFAGRFPFSFPFTEHLDLSHIMIKNVASMGVFIMADPHIFLQGDFL